jgi:tetratricopeptide (TPR) repeat protein
VKRPLIALIFFLMLTPSVLGADAFYESQLNQGISNSNAYSYMLIREARQNKAQSADALKKALAYSPDLPAVYFSLSRASFSLSGSGILNSVDYIVQGVSAYSRNFWWSFTLTESLFFSLVLSFVLSIAVLIVLRLFSDMALLTHDLKEGNLHPFVLAGFFLVSLLGPLPFLAGLLVLLGIYMKRLDKAVVYLFLLFLLCSPLIMNSASRLINAYTSGSVRAAVDVNQSQDNGYAITSLKDRDDFVPLFSYALALKREGRFEEAIPLYKRLLEKSQDPRVYVNLGNCYVGLYNFDEQKKAYVEEALRDYQAAVSIKPLASAYYNLSEMSREMLDFPRGDEYFRTALSLDRTAVGAYRAVYSRTPNRVVADETLPPERLWEYVWRRPSATSTFGAMRVPPAFVSVLAVILLAVSYLLDKRQRNKSYRCRKCETVLCQVCEKGLMWGQMCPRCYGAMIKLDESDVKERVARLLSVYSKQRARRAKLKLFSFILPGSAQIYAGRILKGFFFLWPFLFFICIPATNSFFLPDTSLASHVFFNWAALYFAAVIYFISNFITRQRIALGWL